LLGARALADSENREAALGPARVSPLDVSPVRQRGVAGADQTDQNIREHNARLIAEVARLTEAVEARDAFLVVAAHELRNPMTPIIGRIQILARAARRPDFEIERLVQSLDQLEWLITRYLKRANVLLDVSRITSGKLALERLPVDVCEVAREVMENFLPMTQHAGSDLTLDLPGQPVVVSGDRLGIEEILDNLVSNAIKYGADKPILLRLGLDEEQHCAVIRISDSGPGISADDQARIFERFERAVQPGEHLRGFGVGLWIVRQLCQGMEGSVRVDSTPGEGSTFSVALPPQSSKDLK
jgi:two-component system, OmpR family, sensor kinase